MKLFVLLFCLIFISIRVYTQTYIAGNVYYGQNNYIEYHAGNLPIIISVPHGGYIEPISIPDRNCIGCIYTRDSYTEELANELKIAIYKLTGAYPHIIFNKLSRIKLDANRDITEGADSNAIAEQSWRDFHSFIDIAIVSVTQNYSKGFYIDLHGHSHTIQRIEIGYLLSQTELQLNDSILNTTTYKNKSSLKNLSNSNLNNFSHTDLLRGQYSFGTLISNKGYPCVPSSAIPYPQTGEPYYSGDYNIRNHSSYQSGTIDGVQLECNQNVRYIDTLRVKFVDSLAVSIVEYIERHYLEIPNFYNFTTFTIDSISEYIYKRQYTIDTLTSYGAIKKSAGADVFSGQLYYAIEPYFSHIATLGMLKSNHPDKYGFTRRWMNWYISHLDSNGQTLNHYYKPNGKGETTCPTGATGLYCNHIDAEDSDPALFWILAYEYYLSSGDLAFFTPSLKIKFEAAAKFIIDSLIKSDNLSIAKRDYPVKYTMDNCEVYKGFLSLSKIEKDIYCDTLKANFYLTKANNTKTAIQTLLFKNSVQLYRPAIGEITDTTSWYEEGITTTLWPQLFGVDSINSSRSIRQRQVLNNNFDGTPNHNWTTSAFLGNVDDYTWASIGYIFSLAGDTMHGYNQANYIANVFKPPYDYPPCYVADASWLIMNMTTKYPVSDTLITISSIANGGNWSNNSTWDLGHVPNNKNDTIIINSNIVTPCVIDTNLLLNQNLLINSGKSLVINADKQLTILGSLKNNSGTNGILLKSDSVGTASLIHNIANIPATVERYIPNPNEFHQLSAPVNLQTISPNFNDIDSFFAWNEPTSSWISYDSSNFSTINNGLNFNIGKGYAVSYPLETTKSFTGSLNQGEINITLTKTSGIYEGWNLLGNPYSSAINWNSSNGWTRDILEDAGSGEKTIWIWNPKIGNYGAYISNSADGTNGVNNNISISQGFWVKASSTGILSMNNNVRVHSSQPFYKSNIKSTDFISLKVSSTENSFSDEFIIKFGNTNDQGGAEKLFSINLLAPNIFSTKYNKSWSINYLTSVSEYPIVPVGFKAGESGNYSISIGNIENFNLSTSILLEDTKTNTFQNLNTNNIYNFTATTTDNTNRFKIHFSDANSINNNIEYSDKNIYSYENSIYININDKVKSVNVFNTLGQEILAAKNNNRNLIKLDIPIVGNYIVKVVTDKNVYCRKVLIK